jgi:hypothetical protein
MVSPPFESSGALKKHDHFKAPIPGNPPHPDPHYKKAGRESSDLRMIEIIKKDDLSN